MPGPLLLLALQATAAPAVPLADTRDIVVTATRLEATERLWRDCRKRGCPADEEIRAAIAHAENLFVAGDYERSRRTLAATIGSTRGAAKRFPVAVGDLRRAEARVSGHLGETDLTRQGMTASRDALATGLGEDDPRTLAQRLLIADAMMIEAPKPPRVGSLFRYADERDTALRTYEKVVEDAHRLGLADLEGRALLRRVALFARLAAVDAATYSGSLRGALKRLADTTDPKLAPYREAGVLVEVKLAAGRGDAAAIERLVAAGRPVAPGTLPPLIHAPPVILADSRDHMALTRQRLNGEPSTARDDQWIDVGFAIDADGRVSDVDVLRESRNRRGDWIQPVLAAVRGRRYGTTAGATAPVAIQRVERYTYTATWSFATNGGIRRQTGVPRVVVLDITADAEATADRTAAPRQLTPASATR